MRQYQQGEPITRDDLCVLRQGVPQKIVSAWEKAYGVDVLSLFPNVVEQREARSCAFFAPAIQTMLPMPAMGIALPVV